MTGKLTTTGRNWSVTTRHSVVNYSRSLVPSGQFSLVILNLFEHYSKKVQVEKDDWRAVSGPEKRFDQQWRGRTVFKIKAGVAVPAEELSHVKSSSKTTRVSGPSDKVKPTYSSPEEKSEKPQPSSPPDEEGKSGSSSSGLTRRLGRKTASPSVEHDEFGRQFIDELEKELEMELDKSDDVRRCRPKGDDVDYQPSSDDDRWEKAKKKPGNLLSLGGFLFRCLAVKLETWSLFLFIYTPSSLRHRPRRNRCVFSYKMRLLFILIVNLYVTPANPGEIVVVSRVKCASASFSL